MFWKRKKYTVENVWGWYFKLLKRCENKNVEPLPPFSIPYIYDDKEAIEYEIAYLKGRTKADNEYERVRELYFK